MRLSSVPVQVGTTIFYITVSKNRIGTFYENYRKASMQMTFMGENGHGMLTYDKTKVCVV